MSLDSNILGLMNQTISWEHYTGTNNYADSTWAAAKTLTCYIEEKASAGGIETVRRADDTVYDPKYQLYFDANNADVQTFSLKDRFTVGPGSGVSAETVRSRPHGISRMVGPQGEDWIRIVSL